MLLWMERTIECHVLTRNRYDTQTLKQNILCWHGIIRWSELEHLTILCMMTDELVVHKYPCSIMVRVLLLTTTRRAKHLYAGPRLHTENSSPSHTVNYNIPTICMW
jgi:hypothetical protein